MGRHYAYKATLTVPITIEFDDVATTDVDYFRTLINEELGGSYTECKDWRIGFNPRLGIRAIQAAIDKAVEDTSK